MNRQASQKWAYFGITDHFTGPDCVRNRVDYWAKKLKKCPVLYTQYKENSLFCHFLLKIEPTAERFSNVLKFYNFKNSLDYRALKSK